MKKILTVVLVTFFLAACSEKTHESYIFVGESEHWKAEYVHDVTETRGEKNGKLNYSTEEEYTLTFTYKGEESELATLQNISYGFETNTRSAKNTREFTEPNTESVFKLSGISKHAARFFPNHEITATIQWDDFEETIELNIEK